MKYLNDEVESKIRDDIKNYVNVKVWNRVNKKVWSLLDVEIMEETRCGVSYNVGNRVLGSIYEVFE